MLTIALAKGRTAEDVWPLFRSASIPVPDSVETSRALVFEGSMEVNSADFAGASEQKSVPRDQQTRDPQTRETLRYLLAKPTDVPTYVHFGVADVGVVGKDVLLESDTDVYELLDLGIARCALCVAGPPSERDRPPRRIATKYPKLAEEYFLRQGTSVDIVPLSGSIELASVIGLTDRIFDLVQTGKTLEDNGLEVFDRVMDISARLIVNRSSYHLRRHLIDTLISNVQQEVKLGR